MTDNLSPLNIKIMLHKEFPESDAGLLGEYLGIPNGIITTLKKDSYGDSNTFFSKVINYWLNTDFEKSWEKLANAVQLCNYGNVAEKLRKKFNVGMALTYNQQPSTDVILTTSQQLLLPGYEEESGIATGDVISRRTLICTAIEMLENKFTDLQVTLLKELKAVKKSVDDLTTKISCLKPDINRYVYHSWKKIVKNNFENLNELFTDLNATVWTIIDHYLLEYFINDFGSKEIKVDMKVYSSEVKKFKEETLVSDFISCWKEAQSDRDIPDFEKIKIKYDKECTTLADLDEFREKFTIKFLPSLTDCTSLIYFGKFEKGSYVVTLHIPNELALDLLNKTLRNCQLFDDFNVVHIFIGKIKVYDKNSDWIEELSVLLQNVPQEIESLQNQLVSLCTKVKEYKKVVDEEEMKAIIDLENCSHRDTEVKQMLKSANVKSREAFLRAEGYLKTSKEANDRVQILETKLQKAEQSLMEINEEMKDQLETSVVSLSEIEIKLSKHKIGNGAYSEVLQGVFRGTKVVVKRLHDVLQSKHNSQYYRRHINIASKIRHPNIVQFIGATFEGRDMICVEVMDSFLIIQLKKEEYFQPNIVKSISLDTAQALSYLHQFKPDPIVHCNVSSYKIALKQVSQFKWQAKLNHSTSMNLASNFDTINPGNPLYSAPEARDPVLQSPKMDIFSLGIVILEMVTGKIESIPEKRVELLHEVRHKYFFSLITRCLNDESKHRPSALDIVDELIGYF